MKKVLMIMVAVCMLLASFPFTKTVYASVQLYLEADRNLAVTAGEQISIPMVLRNLGTTAAGNVTISTSSATAPSTTSVNSITSLEAGYTQTLIMVVNVPDGAADHDVTVSFTYDDAGVSKLVTYDFSITASVEPVATARPVDSSAPNIIMTSPTSIVELDAGKSKPVSIVLKNLGKGHAGSITAYLSPNENLTASFSETTNVILSINSGIEKTMTANIGAPLDLASGTYPVEFSYIYYDSAKVAYQGKGTFYIKVNNPDKTTDSDIIPVVVLDSFSSSTSSVIAGNAFNVSMKMRNDSKANAANVQVSLSSLDTKGITIENGIGNAYYNGFNQGKVQDISFVLNTNKEMETGSYPIKFDLTYYDSAGKSYTGSYTYFISVVGKASSTSKGNLEIVSITTPTGTYKQDEAVKFNVTVKNVGDNEIKNLKISSIVADKEIVPRSASIQQVTSLAVGATKTIGFEFSATSESKTQSYTIGFNFDYNTGAKDDAGVAITESFNQYSSMSVSNPEGDEDGSKSVPKIIVSEYLVDPIIVQAGQEFDLNLTFKNTHATKTVSNIKVSFTVTETTETKGNVFTPVNGSNTHYIEEIAPKAETSHYMRMYTVPDAAPRNYIITISFEYEDNDGNEIKGTEQIGVNVKQITKLDLGDLFLPTDVMMGESIFASMTVHNTGKVTLNNFKIKFEGEGFNTSSSEIIYGNFAAGSYDYYDATLNAMMTGPQALKMIASYDDDAGEHHEIVQDYSINVSEAPAFEDMGMEGNIIDEKGMMIDPETGLPIEEATGITGFIKTHWIWFTVGAVVVLGVTAGIIIVVIKKKKRSASLDE